ncbi:hypothetical protein ACKI2C_21435 [Streptomyces brasiliscabiei]|uniref:hypothetical protein n=1 Tax=Streptomyces brasiliscabiei TaxID=2736302 RepID=UPI0038F69291
MPETDLPEMDVPETDVPEMDVPETERPRPSMTGGAGCRGGRFRRHIAAPPHRRTAEVAHRRSDDVTK